MELGIGFDAIMSGLKNFKGTDRRFEKKGEIGGVTIIDDYAHHPQEIAATLSAAKIIRTRNCGVYSSHIPIPVQRHF